MMTGILVLFGPVVKWWVHTSGSSLLAVNFIGIVIIGKEEVRRLSEKPPFP